MPTLSTRELLELLLRCFVEAGFLIAVLWAGYRYAGLAGMLRPLSNLSRRFVVAFVSLWLVVHLVDRWQYSFPTDVSFYPLTRFAMYQIGHGQEVPRAYRFDGLYEDGSRDEVNFSLLFGAIGLPSLSTRFRVVQEGFESNDPARYEWAAHQVDRFCESAARRLEADSKRVPSSIEFRSVVQDSETGAESPRERVLHVWRPGA